MKLFVFFIVGALSAAPAHASEHETDLFNFGGSTGNAPQAGVIVDQHGTLFGTTTGGGNNTNCGEAACGTVFALLPPAKGHTAWKLDTLYNFQGGQDGSFPVAPLTLGLQGSLYGYTGSSTPGTVFQLVPSARGSKSWTFNILYTFTGKADGNLEFVYSPLVFTGGALYGVASGGSNACGSLGCGSLFELAPPQSGNGPWTETTLFSFSGSSASGIPTSVVFDGQQSFYVATALGNGAVVQLSPTQGGGWSETVLTQFAGGADGSDPFSLLLNPSGVIYGLANEESGTGLVFDLAESNSEWTRTNIAHISDNGFGPSSISLGPKGSVLGAIQGDIDFYDGSVFKLMPGAKGWTYKELWGFSPPQAIPLNLIVGRGHNLFGVMNGGSNFSFGSLFELQSGQ